eukprot:56140_1
MHLHLLRHGTVYKYKSVALNINHDASILFDFLIDGYIRFECNKSNSLFPGSVKDILSLYTDNANAQSTLKSYIDSKREKMRAKCIQDEFTEYWRCTSMENHHILSRILIYFFISIAFSVSIAAVIVGFSAFHTHSYSSYCGDIHYSLIDPVLFIIICGLVSIVHIILIVIARIKTYSIINRHQKIHVGFYNARPFITYTQTRHISLYLCYIIPSWIMFFFYGVWSIIGFIVYRSEMTNECQRRAVGMVQISWSVIMFIVALCCYGAYGWIKLPFEQIPTHSITQDSRQKFVFFYPSAVISIVLLWIHNDALCSDRTYGTMRPRLFGVMVGIASCLHMLWIIGYTLIESPAIQIQSNGGIHTSCLFMHPLFNAFMSAFYVICSIFGFNISTEMSEGCKGSAYGTLLLTWCGLALCETLLWWLTKMCKTSIWFD